MIAADAGVARLRGDAERDVEDIARFRAVLAGATLLMLLLSTPLWLGSADFPRVPFLPVDLEGPRWLVVGRMALACAGLLGAAFGFVPGLSTLSSVAILLWSVLADQERFQPWVYQFLLSGTAIALLPPRRGLQFARWIIVAIYLFSGVSKLDFSFTRELGPTFLAALLRPTGVDLAAWSTRRQFWAILAMPAVEIVTALFLLGRSTRRLGLIGATAIHLGLIFILGPWGLGHSPIVLLWNGAMLLEAWVLFAPGWRGTLVLPHRPETRLVETCLRLFLVAPLLEPFGRIDPWPAHALYASHVERVIVEVSEDGLDRLPAPAREASRPTGPGGFVRIDLTSWSRAVRGVPVYPGRRANLALAEWIASRVGPEGAVRAIVYGRANRLTGER